MDVREKRCPRCGGALADGAVVCRHCGSVLTGEGGSAEPGFFGQEAVKLRRRRGTLFWLLMVLGIVCFIGLGALMGYLVYQGVSELADDPDALSYLEQFTGEDADIDAGIDALIDGSLQGNADDVLNNAVDDAAEVLDSLDDVHLEALGMAYVSCFSGNDRDAMAALFHPAALEAYEGDANAMIEDLDEQAYLYGTTLINPEFGGAIEVEANDVKELSDALGVSVERAMVMEYSAQSDAGEEVIMDLLCVRVDGQWYLYYAY